MRKDTKAEATDDSAGKTEDQAADVEVTETSGSVVAQDLPTLEDFLERDYRMGEWSGIPNFGCPRCAFRTLQGNAVVAEHYFTAHLSREV